MYAIRSYYDLITFAFLAWVFTFVAILALDWQTWWLDPLYTLDNQPSVKYNSPFVVEGSGLHTIRYTARDQVV